MIQIFIATAAPCASVHVYNGVGALFEPHYMFFDRQGGLENKVKCLSVIAKTKRHFPLMLSTVIKSRVNGSAGT